LKKWEVAERDKKVVRTANLLRVISLSMIKQATNLAPNQASFNLTAQQDPTINRYNHMASKHLLSLLLFVNFM
jgi:hypothetical protein